jgi:hypothetical protein
LKTEAGPLVAASPDKIHTVLADDGMAFADLSKNKTGPTRSRTAHRRSRR